MPLFTIKKSEFVPVPPGAYKAKFDEMVETETVKGKAYRWKFTVSEGAQAGSAISSFTDREYGPSPKNKMGRWMAALAGTSPTDGLSINTDNYVGKEYMLIVTDDGKIESFAVVA